MLLTDMMIGLRKKYPNIVKIIMNFQQNRFLLAYIGEKYVIYLCLELEFLPFGTVLDKICHKISRTFFKSIFGSRKQNKVLHVCCLNHILIKQAHYKPPVGKFRF